MPLPAATLAATLAAVLPLCPCFGSPRALHTLCCSVSVQRDSPIRLTSHGGIASVKIRGQT